MRATTPRHRLWLITVCNVLIFFLGHARAGTFKNPPIVPTSSDVVALATADLNHDGKLDLVYLDGQGYGSNALHILLGNGNGTFTHAQDISLPLGICCDIAVADVTGDGNPDIIMAGSVVSSFVVQIATLIGNGDGTFQQPLVSSFQENVSGNFPSYNNVIAIGDINGDGKADLVINDYGVLCVLLGDGSGRFTLASSAVTYVDRSVYLVDLKNDYHLDVVMTDLLGADFMVLLGNGDGTFQTGVRYTAPASTGAFMLVDVDGDGHPDMLAQSYPGQIGYFKGNPDGTFAPYLSSARLAR